MSSTSQLDGRGHAEDPGTDEEHALLDHGLPRFSVYSLGSSMFDAKEIAPSRPRIRPGLVAKVALTLTGTAALFVLVEGTASLILAGSVPGPGGLTERSHCEYDPLLGWIHRAGVHVEDLYGPGLDLTTNARRLRGTSEVAPRSERFRVLCLGDSFTLGHGVDDRATFPAWIATLNPGLEAPNMGQGGYGVDQCYLWYRRDAEDLEAPVVLLSFIAPDFERMSSDRFQGQYPKPRLTLEGETLVHPTEELPREWSETGRRNSRFLQSLSIVKLLDELQWERGGARPADPDYQPVAEAVLLELKRLVEERGGKLVLAHIPVRDLGPAYTDALLAWLKPFAEREGLPVIDLLDEFSSFVPGEADSLYLPDGHMSASGNRRLAELLVARLRGLFPEMP